MTDNERTMIREHIFNVLENASLDWHAWKWWGFHDSYLAQFPEDVIDDIALDMANEGLIETNFYDVNGMWGFAGFRRIRKTWKEKIMCRLSK